MTSQEDISASYSAERSYQWNLDEVIDNSDAVLAIGNAKEDTSTLSDLSSNGNHGTINGPMPSAGFFMGRRFDGVDDYLDCGNDGSLNNFDAFTIMSLFKTTSSDDRYIFDKESLYRLRINGGKLAFIRSAPDWGVGSIDGTININDNKIHLINATYNGSNLSAYVDTVLDGTPINKTGNMGGTGANVSIGAYNNGTKSIDGIIYFSFLIKNGFGYEELKTLFNTLARLQFWSINYTDYPDNAQTYTDRLPFSTTVISSGTFKKDAGVLDCVSAGTITYRAAHSFDGSEFIVVNKGLATEFSGTGSATSGNTTVSAAQGSNKVTIQAGTGDTIDKVDIQFRAEV